MTRPLVWAAVLSGAALVLGTVCKTSATGPGNVGLKSKSEMISPAGGMVALDDGTRVDIPAGALAAPTMITISRPDAQAFSAEGVLASVQLQPEGLTFPMPVQVTIPYAALGMPAADLRLGHASTANAPRDVGGEQTITEIITDATATQFTASIRHFSVLHVFYYPQLFVAPELPGRYLRSGDLLYALTNGENHKNAIATPMHVGLFVTNAICDGTIESTLPTARCPAQNGVSEGDCGFRSLRGQHIFIGARRPTAARPTAATATAGWGPRTPASAAAPLPTRPCWPPA